MSLFSRPVLSSIGRELDTNPSELSPRRVPRAFIIVAIIPELFVCPLVNERCSIVGQVLETMVSAEILQTSLPEDGRSGQENLDCDLSCLRVLSMVDSAFLARFCNHG